MKDKIIFLIMDEVDLAREELQDIISNLDSSIEYVNTCTHQFNAIRNFAEVIIEKIKRMEDSKKEED